jgi:hypothetical protein
VTFGLGNPDRNLLRHPKIQTSVVCSVLASQTVQECDVGDFPKFSQLGSRCTQCTLTLLPRYYKAERVAMKLHDKTIEERGVVREELDMTGLE